jgi:deoxyadenosine/deoxycytidine kinase
MVLYILLEYTKQVMILCIEGNIGSGKSTFMTKLKEAFRDREDVCFLDEPVEAWTQFKDEEGGILEHYYKDQKAWAFSFQMLAYISRLSILRSALSNPKYKYIITERSLLTDREVFCKMLFEQGFIHPIQYQIYQAWFDEFRTEQDYEFIYLRTSPDVAHWRVNKRGRKGESIPLEYLEECHRYHEDWLKDALILNANVEEDETGHWVSMVKEVFLR